MFRRNAIFMPLYQLLIGFVLLVGFAAVLRRAGPGGGRERPGAARASRMQAFPDWFVGLHRRRGHAVRAGAGLDAADRVGDDGRAQHLQGPQPERLRRDRADADQVARPGDRARPRSRSCSPAGRRSSRCCCSATRWSPSCSRRCWPRWSGRAGDQGRGDGGHRGGRRGGGGDVVLRRHAGLLDDGRLADRRAAGFLAQLNLGVLALIINIVVTGVVSVVTSSARAGRGAVARWASGAAGYPGGMCRNIRPLYNFEPPATSEEVRAASLQYVRKISGFTKPSQVNQEAFDRAVEEIAHVSMHLLAGPRDRRAAQGPRGRGGEGPRPGRAALRRVEVRVVVIPEHGDPGVLRVEERPDPPLKPGHVRIEVGAAGVNFADTMARIGRLSRRAAAADGARLRGGGHGRGGCGHGRSRDGRHALRRLRVAGRGAGRRRRPAPRRPLLRAGRRHPRQLLDGVGRAGRLRLAARGGDGARARGGGRRRDRRHPDRQARRRRRPRHRLAAQARRDPRPRGRRRARLHAPGLGAWPRGPLRHRARRGRRRVVPALLQAAAHRAGGSSRSAPRASPRGRRATCSRPRRRRCGWCAAST